MHTFHLKSIFHNSSFLWQIVTTPQSQEYNSYRNGKGAFIPMRLTISLHFCSQIQGALAINIDFFLHEVGCEQWTINSYPQNLDNADTFFISSKLFSTYQVNSTVLDVQILRSTWQTHLQWADINLIIPKEDVGINKLLLIWRATTPHSSHQSKSGR